MNYLQFSIYVFACISNSILVISDSRLSLIGKFAVVLCIAIGPIIVLMLLGVTV